MAVGDSATLQRCAAAVGDCDGLLFGRASRLPAPPPSLSDYDDHAAAPALSISVSGHCSLSHPSSLSDPLGRLQPPSAPSASATVGFFSSRHHTPLRPSTREVAVASSLSKSLARTHPLLFLLQPLLLHPHSYDYRAFLLAGSRLVAASLTVVNVGTCFRDQYHPFTAESPLPWLPPATALQGIIGSAAGQAAELDGMYAGMLRRLEKLAREAGKSNLRVLEQENRNLVLRFRYAGLQ